MFVANRDLAELICEYVLDNYDLYDDEVNELSDKYEDYYVSLYFYGDEVKFYCESARGCSGEYKLSDAIDEWVDYFICNDMSEKEANDKLVGDNCTWSWIDVIGEDDCVVESNLCKCCQCDENDCCNDYACTCGELECDGGEDEVEDELCQCVYCKSARGEFSEEEEYEIELVEYYADLVESNKCTCGAEIRNILYSFLQEGIEIGYERAKEEMMEFLED
jgi:hypothetical protein